MQIVLIDIDNTLNNLTDKWVELYNKKYNDNLLSINVNEWDISKFVKPECGKKIYDLLETPGLFLSLSPLKDSQDVMGVLTKYYDVYIVTSCLYAPNCVEKYNWIKEMYPTVNLKNFITCHNKSLLKGDYIIDDNVDNIRHFNGKKLLYNQSHNLFDTSVPIDAIRVNSWEDIFQIFAYDNPNVGEEFNEWYVNKPIQTINYEPFGGRIEKAIEDVERIINLYSTK
jgi:5'(3')-deoxyribonucleotidase